jgi:MFS family permease
VTKVKLAAQRTFRSLHIRNYRLFFFGQLVSVSGTWMQQLAQDWLVLRLTNRALPVGITTALQFAPVLVLGVWGGLIADRLDKRKLLIATQASMGALALALGILTATGEVRLWMIYLLALLLGCATSFDMPARQSFVTEMVGPEYLANAVGLNSAVFNSARIIGPAAAGVFIGILGMAPAFIINAVSYLAVMVALWMMDPSKLYRKAGVERSRGQVREGLRYVWATPTLRWTLLLMGVVATFGLNFRVALPLLSRFTFHGGPGLYGTLASLMAVGSVAGALTAASRSRPTQALLLWSVAGFGLSALILGFLGSAVLAGVLLVPVGFFSIAWISTANTTVQLGSTTEMRGRVMSIYGLLLLGSAPLGALLIGWMSEQWGPRSTLLLAGVSSLVAGGVAFLVRPGRKRAAEGEVEAEPEPAPARTATAGTNTVAPTRATTRATTGGVRPGTVPAPVSAAAGSDEAA